MKLPEALDGTLIWLKTNGDTISGNTEIEWRPAICFNNGWFPCGQYVEIEEEYVIEVGQIIDRPTF